MRKMETETPIARGVQERVRRCIGRLIAAGARVDVVANDGETPLHLAVKSGTSMRPKY
jgi:ankyrin repeat protein